MRLIWQEHVRVLTGNGPQAIDQQAAKLRELLTARRDTRPAASAAVS